LLKKLVFDQFTNYPQAAFVSTLHGASRAFLTSEWRNLTVGQIMFLPNYVIVTSKTLCSLRGAWKRMRPQTSQSCVSIVTLTVFQV